jgi:hypothetical protein
MAEEKDKEKNANGSHQKPSEPNLPEIIPAEVMEQIPKEAQPIVRRAISSFGMQVMGQVPHPNPLVEKITSEHVGKIIDYAEKESVRDSEERKSGRKYTFAVFVVITVVFAGLLVFFAVRKETDMVINLLIAVFSLAGGFGIGRYFRKE